MRSDDKAWLTAIFMSVIGIVLLYFTFFRTLEIHWAYIIVSMIGTVFVIFFLVLALETRYDFYYK